MRNLPTWYWTILISLFAGGILLLIPNMRQSEQATQTSIPTDMAQVLVTTTETPIVVAQAQAEEVISIATNTLLPPPTLEPPTSTPQPSATPTITPTQSIYVNVQIAGIQGLPTATISSEVVCEVRADWTLDYTVQANETLSSIAAKFDTYASTIADGNCLEDANMIRLGQVLKVPGDSLPVQPAVACEPYQELQPFNGAWDIPATGQLVFNWEGTDAPRNLLRLYPPEFDFDNPDPDLWIDYSFAFRRNYTLDLSDIPDGGTWYWQIYPLDESFSQVCPESPRWTFVKLGLDS